MTEQTESPEEQPIPEISLAELPDHLQQACKRAGWTALMPVQAKGLPPVMAGKDVMVQARTGSGKTGAFILPILDKIDPRKKGCQALVLLPTRELCKQVADEAQRLGGPDGPGVVAVYGGVSYGPQRDAFNQGVPIVVGTPGRLLDHMMHGALTLENLKVLVFDEADRMLSIGFYHDMRNVQRYLPERKVQTLMFSATFPPLVLQLAGEFQDDPEFMGLSGSQIHVAEVEHVYYEAPAMGKERALVRIIEVENPESAIVFCNTKANVEFVTAVLSQFGYDADMLSSDVNQNRRERVLTRVREGSLRFLVATDVAARGIDIPALSHVILYEPPEDHESYIHRAGRTGRAGAGGVAISLVDMMQKIVLERIAVQYDINFAKRDLPTDEEVAKVAGERARNTLESEMRQRDAMRKERMRRFLPLAKELADDEDGLALLAMLIDDAYQGIVHGPRQLLPMPNRSTGGRGKPRGGSPGQGGRQGGSSGRQGGRPGGSPQAQSQPPQDARDGQDQDTKPRRRRRPRKRKPKTPQE